MGDKVTVARHFASLIAGTGVKTVMVLQGGSVMKVIDEIGQHPGLSYVSPNHEQALAMMVDGYARIQGFGVGVVTSGPGGLNLVTGIADAYYDSIPCLFITGQVGMFHVKGERQVRQRGFQETDIVTVVESITKYAVMLKRGEDLRYEFEKAVHLAREGRPGPVLIDLPYNVQREMVDPDALRGFTPEPKPRVEAGPGTIGELVGLFKQAQRPVFVVGGGIRLAERADEVNRLIEVSGAPVVTTWSAADVFAADNPVYLGNTGRNGNPSAIEVVQRADLVVGIGTRFTTKNIINEKEFAKNAKIAAVDIDPGEMENGLLNLSLRVSADLRTVLPELVEAFERNGARAPGPWVAEARELKRAHYAIDYTRDPSAPYVSPYNFMAALSEALDPRAIIVGDTGCTLIWLLQGYRPKRGQRMLSAWGCSPMGFAVAGAAGACVAAGREKAQVVAVIGDGGMQMNIQELQTLVVNEIPVKIFVFNNNQYGNIRFPAREQFEGRIFATDPTGGYRAPDFVKVAEAYGLKAVLIDRHEGMEAKIREVLNARGPALAELKLDPEQEMLERLKL